MSGAGDGPSYLTKALAAATSADAPQYLIAIVSQAIHAQPHCEPPPEPPAPVPTPSGKPPRIPMPPYQPPARPPRSIAFSAHLSSRILATLPDPLPNLTLTGITQSCYLCLYCCRCSCLYHYPSPSIATHACTFSAPLSLSTSLGGSTCDYILPGAEATQKPQNLFVLLIFSVILIQNSCSQQMLQTGKW